MLQQLRVIKYIKIIIDEIALAVSWTMDTVWYRFEVARPARKETSSSPQSLPVQSSPKSLPVQLSPQSRPVLPPSPQFSNSVSGGLLVVEFLGDEDCGELNCASIVAIFPPPGELPPQLDAGDDISPEIPKIISGKALSFSISAEERNKQRPKKTNWLILRRSLKVIGKEYCTQSSICGLKHLVNENTPYIERLNEVPNKKYNERQMMSLLFGLGKLYNPQTMNNYTAKETHDALGHYHVNDLMKSLQFSDAYDFPDSPSGSFAMQMINPNVQMTVSITASFTEASRDIQHVPVELRNCLFYDESSYLPFYTYSDCMLKCRMLFLLEKCNCTPFNVPKLAKSRTCDLTDVSCLDKYYVRPHKKNPPAELELDLVNGGLDCPMCYPTCSKTLYNFYFYNVKIYPEILNNDPDPERDDWL
ncbi:unnamed protein product [Diatraea saccharalis]|uniref:Uncharacterized protein n=1 Tax=Diatraea saccharalis TaxID=40085 RepID=A0A9N9R037_9NEOP|nr:unnamed protein product [Diatraea saccharalis]